MRSYFLTYFRSAAADPNAYTYLAFGICVFVGVLSLLFLLSSASTSFFEKLAPSRKRKRNRQALLSAYQQTRLRPSR
jgi:hypothetical protein